MVQTLVEQGVHPSDATAAANQALPQEAYPPTPEQQEWLDDGPNSVNNQLEDEFGGNYSSVREARRPKMCPYHKEVTDISLASGDPTAGFNAMSQHAWGAQHCQGEFEGGCNFKPAMVTQKYWDDKADQAAERRERREQERAEQIQQEQTITEVPDSPEGLEDTPAPVEEGSLDADLAEAPSAVGEGLETSEPVSEPVSDMGSLEPMAAAYNKEGEALKTIDVEQPEGPSPKMTISARFRRTDKSLKT